MGDAFFDGAPGGSFCEADRALNHDAPGNAGRVLRA
jgi:hypothetical protein